MCALRVVEFFSGIGGMHMALIESGVPFELVAALDINTTANAIYKHNFPDCNIVPCNIEGITAAQLDAFAADIFVMSPPCQPFSRLGRRGDIHDPRCAPFLSLLRQMALMKRPPTYLLLENVAGFEKSQAREFLLQVMCQLRLDCREFLLSPSELLVPNSRLRYYLMARRSPNFPFNQPSDFQPLKVGYVCLCAVGGLSSLSSSEDSGYCPNQCTDSTDISSNSSDKCSVCDAIIHSCGNDSSEITTYIRNLLPRFSSERKTPTLRQFLADVQPSSCEQLQLSNKQLARYAQLADIVDGDCCRSCCITAGYGARIEATGSVFTCATAHQVAAAFAAAERWCVGDERRAEALAPLQLRHLSVREVTRLMCFPHKFDTNMAHVSRRQMYRVLGNSVNVRVVTLLLTLLLTS